MYFRQAEAPDDPAPPAVRLAGSYDRAGLRNLQQLIQLRWIAVVGQVATILVVQYGLGIALPLQPMFAVLAALVLFNLASHLWCRRHTRVSHAALLVGLLVDVASLTVQLYLSGGIANPFVFLFLLQVVIGTVLLRSPGSWVIAAAAALCVVGLAAVPAPLKLAVEPARGLADHYVQGLLVCFLLIAGLLVVFITRIGGILRERDARLAELRQRAVEEEHIVRMGLLASGAAHELGTPLSTLAVILGDWQHDKRLTSNAALKEDIAEMQTQVQRCKSIVSGILLSAGETRGEASVQTTVRTFVDALAEEWRSTRTIPQFDYDNDFGTDTPMVSDTTLKQMVFNVLDNARDASPGWVRLAVTRNEDALCMTVTDAGPGFAPDMLSKLGTPYQSSKNRPGGGLGLYLVLNVARTLGGSVEARNRPEGGAQVTIELPLASIALPQKV